MIQKNKKFINYCLAFSFTILLNSSAVAASYQHDSLSTVLGSSLQLSMQNDNSELVFQKASHRFINELTKGEEISSLQYRQNIAGDGMHLNLSQSETEHHAAIGYTMNGLTFSAIQGKAQSFIRDAGSLQYFNRFSLHGGIDSGFDFYGAGIHSSINDSLQGQFGFAQLDSHQLGLESRGVQYVELSAKNTIHGFSGLYGRLSTFSRGEDQIGKGVEAGFSYKNSTFTLQSMAVDGNKRLFGMGSQISLSDSTQLFFQVSKTTDPLHYDATRYQTLFSIQHVLGKQDSVIYRLNEETASNSKSKNRALRPIIIGASIIAGAALASSGNDTVDSSARNQSETDAAFAVLNTINPRSIRENREYGGWVYRNQDQTYGTSTPVAGQAASVTLPNPSSSTPAGSRLTASYHTHAAFDPRYDNENFSSQDIRSDNSIGIGGYLATPGGTFQYHFGGNIVQLGTVATE